MTSLIALLAMTQQLGFSPVTVRGDLDVRKGEVGGSSSIDWAVQVELKRGRAAGVLVWTDAQLEKGYSIRLDSRLGLLILSRVGKWPEEERLATYRWEPIDGAKLELRIRAENKRIRVWDTKRAYPLLEAYGVTPFGQMIGAHVQDGEAVFTTRGFRSEKSKPGDRPASALGKSEPMSFQLHTPQVGAFQHVFDQSPNNDKSWYINDHCFIQGPDGWHVYGITHKKPANPMDERNFSHGFSSTLLGTWQQQPFALTWDPKLGENHLWAPHVIKKGDTYYMFYCAGSLVSNYHYQINLATSKDLRTWTRSSKNPIFKDFYDARDPMVLLVGDTYYLYYTANLDKEDNHHIVNVRTSKNLLDWSPARVAFIHPEKGTFGGPTESPFVVHYGDHFYLFCGPDGDYHATKVYRSANPYQWEYKPIYTFPSHAAEVVQDGNNWYASAAGWDRDGVYLAPLTWKVTGP